MKLKRTRIAATLAAVALMTTAQAAFATTTLSVDGTTSPAGPVTTTGTTGLPSQVNYQGSVQFETDYAVTTACSSADIDGYVDRGASGGIGTKIGAITDFRLNDCLSTALYMPSLGYMDPTSSEWTIHLIETPSAGQRFIKVEIRDISALMRSPSGLWHIGMHLTGTVQARLDTTLDRLVIDTRSLTAPHDLPLRIDALDKAGTKGSANWSTMFGEVQDGDLTSIRATFQLDRDISVS